MKEIDKLLALEPLFGNGIHLQEIRNSFALIFDRIGERIL